MLKTLLEEQQNRIKELEKALEMLGDAELIVNDEVVAEIGFDPDKNYYYTLNNDELELAKKSSEHKVY